MIEILKSSFFNYNWSDAVDLPRKICSKCLSVLSKFNFLRLQCIINDEKMKKLINPKKLEQQPMELVLCDEEMAIKSEPEDNDLISVSNINTNQNVDFYSEHTDVNETLKVKIEEESGSSKSNISKISSMKSKKQTYSFIFSCSLCTRSKFFLYLHIIITLKSSLKITVFIDPHRRDVHYWSHKSLGDVKVCKTQNF